MTVAAITAVLGGRKTLKRNVDYESELTLLTREGLPVSALTSMANELLIDRRTLARVIGISDRTLSRRLASVLKLSAEESDRTMRVARVFALTKDTLGTSQKASSWLQTANRALDGAVPLDLMDTDTPVAMTWKRFCGESSTEFIADVRAQSLADLPRTSRVECLLRRRCKADIGPVELGRRSCGIRLRSTFAGHA